MPGASHNTGEPLSELGWLLLFLPNQGRSSLGEVKGEVHCWEAARAPSLYACTHGAYLAVSPSISTEPHTRSWRPQVLGHLFIPPLHP